MYNTKIIFGFVLIVVTWSTWWHLLLPDMNDIMLVKTATLPEYTHM